MEVGAVAQAERGVASSHEGTDLVAQRGAQPDRHPGIGLAEAPQAFRHRGARQRPDQRQRDGSPICPLERPDGVDAVAHGRQQRLGMGQERLAGGGEDDAARDPLEERRAQLALEQAEAPADSGLREVEGRGRPGEPAETGDGDQGLELADLHRHQHSVWV